MALDPSIVIATVGATNANSFVTFDEYQSYKELNAIEPIEDQGPDHPIRCLVRAGKRLNRERWLGTKVSTAQGMSHPRYDLPKADPVDGSTGYGYGFGDYYLSTEIAQEVKDAQCELAMEYERNGTDESGDDLKSWSADGVSVNLKDSKLRGSLPDSVLLLISPFLTGNELERA